MREHNADRSSQQLAAEDILLAVLGLLAGPLLWWIGRTWENNPAASSMQTLEYWIALLCGFVGIGLSVLWLIFLTAGLGFAVALKTKNKVIGYWSGLFTPKFLQRIIISVFGIQLALGSQAFAAKESPSPSPTTEVVSTPNDNPFMPEVAEQPQQPSAALQHSAQASNSPSATETPSDVLMQNTSPTNKHPSNAPAESEGRRSSEIHPDNQSLSPALQEQTQAAAQPKPRQTTTIPGAPVPATDESSNAPSQRGISDVFVPQKPLPSPYISAPNADRSPTSSPFVIKAGDSLWDIAHQELGAEATLTQIDQRWRQWWQHNHDVLGDDPHTLVPGTVLDTPPFTH